MKKALSLLAFCLLCLVAAPFLAEDPPEEAPLPIHLTEEEKLRLHEIGMMHQPTAPPPGIVRNPAEWEPSEGVIIRWPLGITVSLIAEMSEDVMVTTIVANASQEASAISNYTAGGVNMANTQFLHAPTDSIWTRDYGPWFIFNDDVLAITDHVYNRPRPYDDVIPQRIGEAWGLDVFGMDLSTAGGNYMSNGLGLSSATELTYHENPGLSETEIGQLILDYLGNEYLVLDYIQSGGIHHIDCWAKFLSPSTVIVKDVSPSHPTYGPLNERAAQLAQTMSPWGVPYEVVRVYCPTNTWYTNSLILNDKVLVPLYGISEDAVALQTYRDVMPGYEVLGFTGSWASEDALHCRTMGVPDRGMLFIDHVPFKTEDITSGDYEISTTIVAHSGRALVPEGLKIHYRVDGGLWQSSPLTAAGGDTFGGLIPAQSEDAIVSYYLEAADESGRVEKHPYIGRSWPHQFTAICPNHPLVDVTPDAPYPECSGEGQWLTAELSGGAGPFTYQWTEDGIDIPGATSSTYLAENTGTHYYNCKVWGDGCISSRSDIQDVALSWQQEPYFEGVSQIANPQEETCTLDLDWDPAVPACDGPAYYNVYRSTTQGFTPGPGNLHIAGLAAAPYRDAADLDHGTEYFYIVRAEDDSNGAEDLNTIELSGTPTGPGGGPQQLFSDDFENASSWLNWTVSTGPGGHTCGDWRRVTSSSQRPPSSSGFYALSDSDACGSGSQTSTDLTSPVIDGDITGLSSVTLEYDLYYRYYNGDNTTVEVYDGSDWQVVWTAPSADVQAHHAWDVTAYAAGNPDFQVRFRYQNAVYDYWFAVDNVVVDGYVDNPCATGSACTMTVNVTPNGTTSVCNGDEIVFTAVPNGGSPPYDYQWTRDGLDIPGETGSTLTVSHVSEESHVYNCRVSDAGLCVDVVDGLDAAGEWSSCTAAVTVPDGSEGGTEPLRVGKDGGDVVVSWDVSTASCNSPGYHLIWGEGSAIDSYAIAGSDCSLDPSGSHLWLTAPDTTLDWAWFLVVGNDGDTTEGGWGTDSDSNQRSVVASGECGTITLDTAACIP